MSNLTLPSQTFSAYIQLLEARKKKLNRQVIFFGIFLMTFLLIRLLLPIFIPNLPSTSVRGASTEPLLYFTLTWLILLPASEIKTIDSQIEFARFLERASQTENKS